MAARAGRRVGRAIGAVVVAALVATVVSLATYGARRDVDLGKWVGAGDAWTRTMVPDARWATDELRGADLPCRQAVRSDTLTMYRFADRDDAVAAVRRFAGEAHLSGGTVVGFFAAGRDCLHVGITEDGVEC